jgi:O-succinylbenzoic acid--CoA ligase
MAQTLCPIAKAAECTPHQIALISSEKSWTYQEFNALVNACCGHLHSLGVRQQQRVAFIAHTQGQTIALLFAVFRMHAIACPLSFREPEERLKTMLERLQVDHFVDVTSLSMHITPTSYETIDLELPATLLFTSGSTSQPKIAAHCLNNHIHNALTALPFFYLSENSKWLLSLPLFHVAGLSILFRCFLAKAAVVLPHISIENTLQNTAISHLSLVPTQLYRLLYQYPKNLASVRFILLGGAATPSSLIEEAANRNLPLFSSYGMTEMSSTISINSKLLPERALKLSTHNELLVRGHSLFLGYWNSGKIDPSVDSEGWFATKDIGKETNGIWTILGRKDNLFISGGENIQPEEIETVLLTLPGILQAVVVPIDDLEFGARPVAFIEEIKPFYSLETLREALSDKLPRYKLPVGLLKLKPHEGKVNRENLKVLAKTSQVHVG